MTLTFSELKKLSKLENSAFPQLNVALLCDSSSQLLHLALKGAGVNSKLNLNIFESDYDQIDIQVLDPDSELYLSNPEFIIINQSVEQLQKKYYAFHNKSEFFTAQLEYNRSLVENIRTHSKARIILNTFPDQFDGTFGNYGATLADSLITNIRKINLGLSTMCSEFNGLFLLDLGALIAKFGYKNAFDSKMYVTSDIVYSLDFIPVIATHITSIIAAAVGQFKKCIILDLDNTMWGGIIGDDGIEGIQIGNFGIGKAFTNFQKWLVQLKKRGIILAVCSKNTEAIAKEVFEKHPDMVLKLEDFAVFVANWDNKVDNILHIQSVLNIGMDSIVFLDDNPFERQMVQQGIRNITVPELPEDPAEYVVYLTEQNLFETVSRTEEDEKRTEQYREEAKRTERKRSFANENEFLKSLAMVGEVSNFVKFNIPRIAQLSQRSNQFNLRTIRLTEEEVKAIANSNEFFTLAISLKDIYGDYGLVAYVILKKSSENSIFIHSWVMSCRVLKRNMEEFTLACIMDTCKRGGFDKIIGEYIKTPKNGIVENHYQKLGFSKDKDYWFLDLNAEQINLEYHINKIEINEPA